MLREALYKWITTIQKDSPFQSEGPTTEKAQFCLVVVQTKKKESIRQPCSVERREQWL